MMETEKSISRLEQLFRESGDGNKFQHLQNGCEISACGRLIARFLDVFLFSLLAGAFYFICISKKGWLSNHPKEVGVKFIIAFAIFTYFFSRFKKVKLTEKEIHIICESFILSIFFKRKRISLPEVSEIVCLLEKDNAYTSERVTMYLHTHSGNSVQLYNFGQSEGKNKAHKKAQALFQVLYFLGVNCTNSLGKANFEKAKME